MTNAREENAAEIQREEQERDKLRSDLSSDSGLTAEQLDDAYNPEGGGEHPRFTRSDWRQAVENEETLTGYWAWVVSEIEQALE